MEAVDTVFFDGFPVRLRAVETQTQLFKAFNRCILPAGRIWMFVTFVNDSRLNKNIRLLFVREHSRPLPPLHHTLSLKVVSLPLSSNTQNWWSAIGLCVLHDAIYMRKSCTIRVHYSTRLTTLHWILSPLVAHKWKRPLEVLMSLSCALCAHDTSAVTVISPTCWVDAGVVTHVGNHTVQQKVVTCVCARCRNEVVVGRMMVITLAVSAVLFSNTWRRSYYWI